MCPVCGAPYRKLISVGVVQVRCSYCGATITVPSTLARCPNHPDTLAASFCNDCGQSYCLDCLSSYSIQGERESGYLNLCPSCLQRRYVERSNSFVLFGALLLIIGIFVMMLDLALGVLVIAVLAAPVFAYALYKRWLWAKDAGVQIALIRGSIRQGPQQTSQEIYQGMLIEYTKSFGPAHASLRLENRVQSYMRNGFTREEAVKKLAKDEGYA